MFQPESFHVFAHMFEVLNRTPADLEIRFLAQILDLPPLALFVQSIWQVALEKEMEREPNLHFCRGLYRFFPPITGDLSSLPTPWVSLAGSPAPGSLPGRPAQAPSAASREALQPVTAGSTRLSRSLSLSGGDWGRADDMTGNRMCTEVWKIDTPKTIQRCSIWKSTHCHQVLLLRH